MSRRPYSLVILVLRYHFSSTLNTKYENDIFKVSCGDLLRWLLPLVNLLGYATPNGPMICELDHGYQNSLLVTLPKIPACLFTLATQRRWAGTPSSHIYLWHLPSIFCVVLEYRWRIMWFLLLALAPVFRLQHDDLHRWLTSDRAHFVEEADLSWQQSRILPLSHQPETNYGPNLWNMSPSAIRT